jgi:transcriptional regulator with XRE-family HTH domain
MSVHPRDEALGRTIRVLRTERGMERKDLAEAAGLSYPYLAEIEKGRKRPSARVLEAIAEALGVRVHELFEGAETRVMDVDASLARPMAARVAATAMRPPPPPRRWFGTRSMTADQVPPDTTSTALRELTELIERMRPEDMERILDLARRLAAR